MMMQAAKVRHQNGSNANFRESPKGEVRAEGRAAGEREIGAPVGMYGRLLLPHQLL
jgi:hypothetical protein